MHASKLEFYSIGIVGENKKLNSKEIEVAPYETMQLYDKEITSNPDQIKSTVKGLDGKVEEHTVVAAATIVAKWLPLGEGNRITAPDVRRGELVMIYKYADADKYFWTTLKEDVRLRKLETVIWAFSGTQNESEGVTAESFYIFEVSTHNGYIKIHTSMANKEPFSYDIEINTKDGKIIITDSIDNYVLLDSNAHRIRLENNDSTFIDLIGESIHGESKSAITWKTKDFTIDAENSYTLSTNNNTQNASSTTVNSDTTTVNGSTASINAALSASMGAAVSGGGMTHEGVNIGSNHTHSGVRSGPSDTGGPK